MTYHLQVSLLHLWVLKRLAGATPDDCRAGVDAYHSIAGAAYRNRLELPSHLTPVMLRGIHYDTRPV